MLQPTTSERHETHFDTSNVSRFPTEVTKMMLKVLTKDNNQEMEIMYDLTDFRHKRLLWEQTMSFINHVDSIRTNFSKFKNTNMLMNPKSMSYDKFWDDTKNSTGLLFLDLTKDQGTTDAPSALLLAIEGTLELNFNAKSYERRLKLFYVFPRAHVMGASGDGFFSINNQPSAFQNT